MLILQESRWLINLYGAGQVWNIDIAILILSKEFMMIRLYVF